MTAKFEVGSEVWIPAKRLGPNQPFALARRRVEGQEKRSVLIGTDNLETIVVSSKVVHADTLGFLVLRVGDLATEQTMLDPLAKSILQYLRLLIPDDVVHSFSCRRLEELSGFMAQQGGAISHVILVGHGAKDALLGMPGLRISPAAFADALGDSQIPRCVISLACKTGNKGFAGELSQDSRVSDVVAPIREVHAAGASMFLQFLLHTHLLHGHTLKTSAKLADAATEGIRFRHWRDGKLLSSKREPRLTVVDDPEDSADGGSQNED